MPDDGCQLETLQANTLNNILQNLSQDHRKIVRDIEKLTRKQIKANFAVIFTSKYIYSISKQRIFRKSPALGLEPRSPDFRSSVLTTTPNWT